MQPQPLPQRGLSIRAETARLHPTVKEIPMKRAITLMLLALFSMGTLTACNTMAGAGEDIQTAGEKIEKEAVEEKND
jgi:entericidin A